MPCAVLVVEDEATLARNIKTYLQRNGYDAETAGSAEEGLAALDSFKPDAVLLDLRLPGMDGLAALARLRASDPSLVVIMITGHGSVEIAVEAMKAGAYDFLTKPVSLSKLKLLLEKALGEARREETLHYHQRRQAATRRAGEPARRVRADARAQEPHRAGDRCGNAPRPTRMRRRSW